MFRKLRNRFIALNMAIITAILIVAFSAIYVSTCSMANGQDFRHIPPRGGTTIRQFSDSDMDVIVEQRQYDSQQSLNRLLFTLIATGAAMLCVAFLVSYYFAEEAIKPVREAWIKQKRFIADASHELKTPLSAIDANFDALLSDHKIKSKWTLNIRGELTRMNKLVSDLLTLARVEDGDLPLNLSNFDLSATVTNSALSMEALAFEKGVEIHTNIEQGIAIRSDEEKLRQVITILFDNAIKYSAKEISIALTKSKNTTTLTIQNDGQKISAADLHHIFDRFYRTDKSRNSSGYGLGLPIAKAITKKLGYKISATSTSAHTTFKLSL